jgi:hypothetical protein
VVRLDVADHAVHIGIAALVRRTPTALPPGHESAELAAHD